LKPRNPTTPLRNTLLNEKIKEMRDEVYVPDLRWEEREHQVEEPKSLAINSK